MYILNEKAFLSALKDRGFNSIQSLANELGMHRNTIHYYLSGKAPVISEKLSAIIDRLGMDLRSAFTKKNGYDSSIHPSIVKIVDNIHQSFPSVSVVLFGSRSRKTAKKYSDYDLGIYSDDGINHNCYNKILNLKNDLEEESPYFVDVVNLNYADSEFLKEISKSWMFLAGRQKDWISLKRKILS